MSPKNLTKSSSTPRVDHVDKHVSQRLRDRRILLGLSQQSLADAVGVSVQQVQKYERATNRISSGKLHHFAKFLDIEIGYFYDGLDDKTPPHIFTENVSGITIDGASERDVLILIRAFNSIEDFNTRKRLLDLVNSISDE